MRLRPRTLRGRLTLVFAVVTAVLCLLVGLLVDFEYRRALRDALDNGLVTRIDNLEGQLATSGDLAVEPSLPDAEAFAQIIGADGEVVNAAPRALLERRVLTKGEIAEARKHRITIERAAVPGAQRSRLLAGPAGQRGLGLVVVVGTSLQEAIEAQRRLELLLVIGLPLLAALVSVGGWFLAGAALTPVRDLVAEADEVSAVAARGRGRRLSVPQSGGEELAQLARHLNELIARIEAALEHERAFLDDASHELRTPISITRSELELARMQSEDGSNAARALDSALEEVERLDRLAVNLLVLARTRSAGPPPPHTVELGALSRRAVDSMSRSRDTDSVSVEVTGSAEARGDEDAIERAVLNLVENAAHHARRRVDVTVSSDSDHAVVAVRDDGPGFPPELLDLAAGRFVRGTSVQSGAGLGLAIVDAIAAAHGGGIVIQNRADGGAEVQLRLPLGPS